jgi:hypothetical protein
LIRPLTPTSISGAPTSLGLSYQRYSYFESGSSGCFGPPQWSSAIGDWPDRKVILGGGDVVTHSSARASCGSFPPAPLRLWTWPC